MIDDLAARIQANQQKLTTELKPQYDFIVCGSGSSGSVVARRLAENAHVSVLLLEAGGSDDLPSVMEAGSVLNLGSELDWNFRAQPNPHLNGRAIPLDMGKVLGGGSSINVMAGPAGTRTTGITSHPRPTSWRGTTSRYCRYKAYRRLACRAGPEISRYGRAGLCPARAGPQPYRSRHAGRSALDRDPDLRDHNGLMMEGDGGASIMMC